MKTLTWRQHIQLLSISEGLVELPVVELPLGSYGSWPAAVQDAAAARHTAGTPSPSVPPHSRWRAT